MVINRIAELKRLHTFSDKTADIITRVAGSMPFLLFNITWFTIWILLNVGVLGDDAIIDEFPFNFLTTAVSLEAIVLSTFVLMSQRRQSRLSELRTALDYRADLQAEADIEIVVTILERLAKKQDVEISDLLTKAKTDKETLVARNHEALNIEDKNR